MNTHNQHAGLPLHQRVAATAAARASEPSGASGASGARGAPGASAPTTSSPEAAVPEYLVPVLARYDDPDEAARRERATVLYCQGHRTADIAARLDVPVSTVTSWLTDARYLLAFEQRVSREELLLRAIESARALAVEAWTAYENDCRLQREILAGEHDYLRRRVTRPGRPSPRRSHVVITAPSATQEPPTAAGIGAPPAAPGTEPDGDLLYEEYERPRLTSQAARLLTVALAAQREVARLQGLYKHVAPPPQPVDFTINGPLPEDADSGDPEPDDQPDQPGATAKSPASIHMTENDDADMDSAVQAQAAPGTRGFAAGIQPARAAIPTAPLASSVGAHRVCPANPAASPANPTTPTPSPQEDSSHERT